MRLYTDLSLTAQTAYAQLLETALSAEHFRSVAHLSGSFSSKTVKGRKYWYFQYTEPSGKLRQVYVGPDTEAVRSLVEKKKAADNVKELAPLIGSAVALGCSEILAPHMRVMHRLSEYGFFRAGGVLVGTHAFVAYGNMLGVKWGDGSLTQDVDFAHAGRNMSIALPTNFELNTHDAITSLEMGFLPTSGFSREDVGAYVSKGNREFRLDFLTSGHRLKASDTKTGIVHKPLGLVLLPLSFMEYSLVDVQQAVLFHGDKAAIVNVPSPARFALHKLLVYRRRPPEQAAKAAKDLMQSAMLLAFLKENRRWDVDEAWKDLVSRGRSWVQEVRGTLKVLNQRYPELEASRWLKLPA